MAQKVIKAANLMTETSTQRLV
jgi:hypothetical protein